MDGRQAQQLDELKRRFGEIKPPLSRDEARAAASRCLFCHDAPCTRACPTHIDVPRFIRQILHGNLAGAAETILDANVLGGSCARVCPTEVLCEGACVDRTLMGEAVLIGLLQRHAVDDADARGLAFFQPGAERPGRVAVLGAGPAGLSCAYELRRAGIAVTIFEARDLAGGLNSLGIAPYKIRAEYSLSEVERVRALGAEIRLDSPIDAASLTRLREDYDAVFLGLGLGKTASLGLPGEEGAGVFEALEFIAQFHRLPMESWAGGRRVAVIGGGNTAMDVASEALRLGAESVTVLYRRGPEEMPAYEHERVLALSDGADFEWWVQPVEFLREGDKPTGLSCRRLRAKGRGRSAALEPIAGSDFVVEADMIVKALGQLPLLSLLRSVEGLALEQGRIRVDAATGATSVPGLYAGGDCANGGREVVHAVEEGKIAARAIAELLAS